MSMNGNPLVRRMQPLPYRDRTGYWAWQEGMLAQFGLPVPGEEPQAVDDPQQSQVAAEPPAIDSTEIRDSIATAERDSLAREAQRTQDALEDATRQLAAERRRNEQRDRTTPRETQPQPQFGAISVNVVSNFGTVYIADARVGRTPLFEHKIAAGVHIVRITRQGCEDRVDTLRVAVDETVRHTVPLTCGG